MMTDVADQELMPFPPIFRAETAFLLKGEIMKKV
jgi:hypothetical protein